MGNSTPKSKLLQVEHQKQETEYCCWAACGAIVLNHLIPISPILGYVGVSGFFKYTQKDVANLVSSNYDSIHLNSMIDILTLSGGLRKVHRIEVEGPLTQLKFDDVVKYLNDDKLIILSLKDHLVVIVGYKTHDSGTQSVYINDPARPSNAGQLEFGWTSKIEPHQREYIIVSFDGEKDEL
jgi:hypothetical protein